MPSSFLVGFGETGGSPTYWSKCAFFKNNNTFVVFADNISTIVSSPTLDTVFKLTTSNLHSISAYMNDVLETTKSTSSSYPLNLRIDDFRDTLELDYIRVKPL